MGLTTAEPQTQDNGKKVGAGDEIRTRNLDLGKVLPYHWATPAKRDSGAGDGNRTHVISLEGWSFTIKLRPQRSHYTDATRGGIGAE